MRVLTDVIDSVGNTVRAVVSLIVLVIIGSVFVLTVGATYTATTATEELATKAEKLGEKAMEEQAKRERNRELAKDGWGYDAGEKGGSHGSRRKDRDSDWGAGS